MDTQKIAASIKCCPNTVKYTLDKEKETGEFEAKKRREQPRNFSEKTLQFLHLTSLKDRKKSVHELMDKCNKLLSENSQVSKSAVSQRL